jgi:hypothetical protein
MFGSQVYPEGRFAPTRGECSGWHVWCHTGARQVLGEREFVSWLACNPGRRYIINFANGAFAHIRPGDPLWERLREIAATHVVRVYPLNWSGRYVPWTGATGDLGWFDAISISLRPEVVAASPA